MKTYMVVEPGDDFYPVYTTWTEEEIFDAYWEFWKEKMKKREEWNDSTLSELVQMCIHDWVVVHWAWECSPGE